MLAPIAIGALVVILGITMYRGNATMVFLLPGVSEAQQGLAFVLIGAALVAWGLASFL